MKSSVPKSNLAKKSPKSRVDTSSMLILARTEGDFRCSTFFAKVLVSGVGAPERNIEVSIGINTEHTAVSKFSKQKEVHRTTDSRTFCCVVSPTAIIV